MRKVFCFLASLFIFMSCSEDKPTLYQLKSSEHTGIDFNNNIIETDSSNILTEEYIFNGGGVAIGDFNSDGLPDIFFAGNQVSNKLYLNKGDFRFEDVSDIAQIGATDRWSTGIALADVNGDDLMDIYVCAAMSSNEGKRANMLFIHQGLDDKGIPIFKEMAKTYGVADSRNSMGATFFDYDKDGLLDLYVLNNEQVHTLPTNYRPKIVDGSAVSNDRLFHNNGDGTFSDVTLAAGIVYEGFGLGIAVADFNYDGWPDIHVSNDYLTNDLLYTNNGDGTFSNNIGDYIKHQSKFSMGSDVSDYNNDGYLDLVTLDMLGETSYRMKTTIGNNNYINYVLNERWDYGYQYGRNMLHKGNGNGVPSSEIGLLAGMSKTDWSWAPLFGDVDNDGFKDLLITNGFPRDITDRDFGDFRLSVSQYLSPEKILDSIPVIKTPNYGYKNTGDGLFEDMGDAWGLTAPSFSNGAAFVDLDNDGDLDYVVNNINDEAFVFENTLDNAASNNQFLKVNLKGPQSNRVGIGAKLVVRYGKDMFQYYEHYLTRGYMSAMDQQVHFGLGPVKELESIEVLWPDGKFQRLSKIKSNLTILIDYQEAKPIEHSKLAFPLVPKKVQSVLAEVSSEIGVDFLHKEKDIVDYSVQRVLPHKLTQNGPCIEAGDINGDGLEDFIVGSSSSYSPSIFFQKPDGTFLEQELFNNEVDKSFEEEGMALFDLENDGDLDLYLVSGSAEFKPDSDQYHDRLLLNDGKGNFTLASDRMPLVNANGSVVKAQDFDNDGFVDLFVGGRTPIAQYPLPDRSFLLKNNAGTLIDVTEEFAHDLQKVGMVTDAIWVDIDNDGLQDLVIVGELMPITFLKNQKGIFKKLDMTGLEDYLGWWESIVAKDFDNDGDMDFVVGNIGSNNFYQPSKERPVTLLAKDFDNNGSVDPVMFAYFKKNNDQYESVPVNFWGDLYGQSPLFRSKFDLYKDYAMATQADLFTEEELKGTKEWIGNYDKSSYIANMGNGKFEITPLPIDAQLAPVNGIATGDFNDDKNLDILLIGNDYGNEIFIGRYDAFNGLMLYGNGKGAFEPKKPSDSGFVVSGDAKDIVTVKSALGDKLYITTQNKGKILVHRKK